MPYEELTTYWINGVRTMVLWNTEPWTPTFLRTSWVRISPEEAMQLFLHFDLDLPFDSAFWINRLFALCTDQFDTSHVQLPERTAIVAQWIESGRLFAWREVPPFAGPSGDQPIDNAVLAPLYRKYAQQIGMDPGTVVAPPAAGSGHKPVIPAAADVPVAERGKALPNAVSEKCPADNWRSESHLTAKPVVIRWLQEVERKNTSDGQNRVLGFVDGGGFLVSTTRVSWLRKGTLIYRYYDAAGGSSNSGGWWWTDLVTGDPRVTLALPPAAPTWSNSARSLARARIAFDITALTGLGAPRCSNKPGGPQQWFISLPDRIRNALCHPDDPTKPFPREP